jgi:uncharacterized membrane protein
MNPLGLAGVALAIVGFAVILYTFVADATRRGLRRPPSHVRSRVVSALVILAGFAIIVVAATI